MESPTDTTRGTDWSTVGLLAAMYAVLVGNFAIYQWAPGPWPLHIAIGVLGIHLSFTIWHEAVHRNVSPNPWVCDAIGVLGVFPYMAPYYIERWFHLQHHRLLNQSDDPNQIYTDGPFWQMPLRYLRILQFARERMVRDPRQPFERNIDRIPILMIFGLYALALWYDVLFDLVLLWFVPLVISKVFMDWYINYLPHVGLPPHRFAGTRIVDLAWFTPIVLCHNYHAIHHLWPDTPWHRYPAVFRDRLDYLREHDVPIERRVTGYASPAAAHKSGADPGA